VRGRRSRSQEVRMRSFQRVLLALVTVSTVAGVSVLSLSTNPAVSGPLRTLGSDVARGLESVRPAAFAPADAAATEFLPPMVITVGPDVTLQGKLTMTGTVTITCGPFQPTSQSSASIT